MTLSGSAVICMMVCLVMQARHYPIQLNSFQPHPARVFAWRQMQLMEQGMSRKRAQREVQKMFEEEYGSRCALALGEGLTNLFCWFALHARSIPDPEPGVLTIGKFDLIPLHAG